MSERKYNSIREEIEGEYPIIMEEMKDAICKVEQASKKALGIQEQPQDMTSIIKRSLDRELEYLAKSNITNKVKSQKQKKEDMKVIEEFVYYIRNYEKNQQVIKEYEEYKDRIEDDGR